MQKNDYKSSIETADYLRALIKTPGWNIIQKFLNNKREYYTQIALTEKDMSKILYAQAYVSVIDAIYFEIAELVKQGEEADKLKK